MANRLSDQEALELQFEGTPIDPAAIDWQARILREELLEAIQIEADYQKEYHKKLCTIAPNTPSCDQSPPPLTMEEYYETIKDFYEANAKFDKLLGEDDVPLDFEGTEQGILVDPVDDFFPTEYQEPLSHALIPTLIITFVIAALALFLRDGIRRLLGRPKRKTGKWGIF